MGVQITRTKAAVSVVEMARMVGLSRARFYQLMSEGRFPRPTYDSESGRPYFDEVQQATCLVVRSRNVGIDGKPILFYARRSEIRPTARRPRKRSESKTHSLAHDVHAELLDAVKALGLVSATSAQVEAAMAELYPQVTGGIDKAEVIRAVFLKLKRQEPGTSERLM